MILVAAPVDRRPGNAAERVSVDCWMQAMLAVRLRGGCEWDCDDQTFAAAYLIEA